MRSASAIALSLAAILALSVLLPGASAQAAPTTGPIHMVGFYLDEASYSFKAPTGAVTKTRSLTKEDGPPANGAPPIAFTTPAEGTSMVWASFTMPNDVTFATDGLMTFWITSVGDSVWERIDVRIYKDPAAANAPTSTPDTTGTTNHHIDATNPPDNKLEDGKSLKLTVPVLMGGKQYKANDKIRIGFAVWGLGGDAAAGTDLLIEYGSKDKPSSFVLGTRNPGKVATLGPLKGLFLAENALTMEAPTGASVKEKDSAAVGSTVPTGGGALVASAEVEWGKYTATAPTKFTHDSYLIVYTKMLGTASATRMVSARLYVGEKAVANGTSNILTNTHQANQESQYRIGLATAGLDLKAGDVVKLVLQFYSHNQAETGKIVVRYGATTHASGLVSVGSGAPAVVLPPPAIVVDVENTADNATDNASDTADNSTANDGSNETSVPETPVDESAGDAAGAEADHEHGHAKDINEAASVPGAGLVIVLVGALVGLVVVRRRR